MTELVPVVGRITPTDTVPDVARKRAGDIARTEVTGILRAAVTKLDELVESNPEDLDGLARVFVLVDTIRADLAVLRDRAAGLMHAASPAYRFEVEGVGAFQRSDAGGKNVWDQDETLRKVMELAEGEFGQFVQLLTECARMDWRVTPFKSRGVDPAKAGLCEKTPGRPSVRRVDGTDR